MCDTAVSCSLSLKALHCGGTHPLVSAPSVSLCWNRFDTVVSTARAASNRFKPVHSQFATWFRCGETLTRRNAVRPVLFRSSAVRTRDGGRRRRRRVGEGVDRGWEVTRVGRKERQRANRWDGHAEVLPHVEPPDVLHLEHLHQRLELLVEEPMLEILRAPIIRPSPTIARVVTRLPPTPTHPPRCRLAASSRPR